MYIKGEKTELVEVAEKQNIVYISEKRGTNIHFIAVVHVLYPD